MTESVDMQAEYGDAERNYQPRSLKFWTIMVGMYLAMFLVALVSDITPDLCYPSG